MPCQITFDTRQWKTLKPHALWPQPCPITDRRNPNQYSTRLRMPARQPMCGASRGAPSAIRGTRGIKGFSPVPGSDHHKQNRTMQQAENNTLTTNHALILRRILLVSPQIPIRPQIKCLQLLVLMLIPQHPRRPLCWPRRREALRPICDPERRQRHQGRVLCQDIRLLRFQRIRRRVMCKFTTPSCPGPC